MSRTSSLQRSPPKLQTTSMNKSQLLEREHPEIFTASPRPGGYIKILVPTKSLDRITIEESSAKEDSRSGAESTGSSSRKKFPTKKRSALRDPFLYTSRDYRISKATTETISEYLDDYDDEDVDDSVGGMTHKTTVQYEINMAAVRTLQTVLLLGEGNTNVKDEMLIISYLFLINIKDEEGNIPPNCHRFLNHLRYLGIEKILRDNGLGKDGKPLPPPKKGRRASLSSDEGDDVDGKRSRTTAEDKDDMIMREEDELHTINMQGSDEKKRQTPSCICRPQNKSSANSVNFSPGAASTPKRDSREMGSGIPVREKRSAVPVRRKTSSQVRAASDHDGPPLPPPSSRMNRKTAGTRQRSPMSMTAG